jgi:CheY-like chemotaxis protein
VGHWLRSYVGQNCLRLKNWPHLERHAQTFGLPAYVLLDTDCLDAGLASLEHHLRSLSQWTSSLQVVVMTTAKPAAAPPAPPNIELSIIEKPVIRPLVFGKASRQKASLRGPILLLEDDLLIAELNAEIIEAKGYEVHHCADASALLRRRQLWPEAIILADLQVPGAGELPGILTHQAVHLRWIITADATQIPERIRDVVPAHQILEKPLSPLKMDRITAAVETSSHLREGAANYSVSPDWPRLNEAELHQLFRRGIPLRTELHLGAAAKSQQRFRQAWDELTFLFGNLQLLEACPRLKSLFRASETSEHVTDPNHLIWRELNAVFEHYRPQLSGERSTDRKSPTASKKA